MPRQLVPVSDPSVERRADAVVAEQTLTQAYGRDYVLNLRLFEIRRCDVASGTDRAPLTPEERAMLVADFSNRYADPYFRRVYDERPDMPDQDLARLANECINDAFNGYLL